jgi:hypothetical protein
MLCLNRFHVAGTRCALREDLCKILLHHPADLAAMQTLIEVLCGVDRPENILTWKRNIQVLGNVCDSSDEHGEVHWISVISSLGVFA